MTQAHHKLSKQLRNLHAIFGRVSSHLIPLLRNNDLKDSGMSMSRPTFLNDEVHTFCPCSNTIRLVDQFKARAILLINYSPKFVIFGIDFIHIQGL